MAIRVPAVQRVLEADQLVTWEAELEARWSQLQARRSRAEKLKEKKMLLEASLRELANENVAAGLILEERRRALSARRTKLQQDEQAQKVQVVSAFAEAAKMQQTVEEETRSIDAAWRELERASQQDDAAHAEEMRALQWEKERAMQREAESRERLGALREHETQSLARVDALLDRKRHSAELLRQTLTQLQRELDARQALLAQRVESRS